MKKINKLIVGALCGIGLVTCLVAAGSATKATDTNEQVAVVKALPPVSATTTHTVLATNVTVTPLVVTTTATTNSTVTIVVTTNVATATPVAPSANPDVAVAATPTNNGSWLPAGKWVMTLGGNGVVGTKGNTQTGLGINGSIGRTLKLGLPAEIGLRQGISYASKGSQTVLSSALYADWTLWTFNLTQNIPVDLFAGGNAGVTYGNTPTQWTAAPEAGMDVWLAKNVALDTRIAYPFNLSGKTKAQEALTWNIGVKFTF